MLKGSTSKPAAEEVGGETDQPSDMNGEEEMDLDVAGEREQSDSNQYVSEDVLC